MWVLGQVPRLRFVLLAFSVFTLIEVYIGLKLVLGLGVRVRVRARV